MHLVLALAFWLLPSGQPAGPFSAWAGDWNRHSFGLTINPDGTGHAVWRLNQPCGQGAIGPCDAPDGRVWGGYAVVALIGQNGNTALGFVYGSTDPGTLHTGQFGLTKLSNGLGDLAPMLSPSMTLCGPTYEQDAPPELKQQLPCGA